MTLGDCREAREATERGLWCAPGDARTGRSDGGPLALWLAHWGIGVAPTHLQKTSHAYAPFVGAKQN